MVNLRFKLLSSSVILMLLFAYGCKKHDLKKVSGLSFNQNLAAPIGYGEFDAHDLLKSIDSTVLKQYPNGEMSLIYAKNIDTIFAQDVVKLDDYTEVFSVVPPLMAVPSFNGVINSPTSVQTFNYTTQNGAELHDLNFQSGFLALNVSSTLQHDITIVVSMPDLTLNNVPVSRTINLVYGGSVPQTGSSVIDLSNMLADFTAGNTATNTLRISIDAMVTGTGQPISGNETLDLTMNLTNLKFKNITGYFGQQALATFADSMLLKIFQNPVPGNVSFTNPKLKFTVDNSFGIPIDVNFSNFSSVNTITNQTTQMVLAQPIVSLNIPTAMGAPAVSTTFSMNKTNTTNISSLIDATPKYLKYSISANSNPAGNVAPLNFIESTSKMFVKVDIELPFEGTAEAMSIKDTMDFSNSTDAAIIESVMFRLKLDNGLPLSFKGNAEFVDEHYNHVFNLFDTPTELISAAPVGSDGVVISSKSKTTDIALTAAKIQLMNKVKYIIISGTADSTPNSNGVKLLNTYKVGVKMSVQVQLKGK